MFALVKDISGQRFGRLSAISAAGRNGRSITWNCVCDCGNSCVIVGTSLRSGETQSCGCLRSMTVSARSKIDNLVHGLSKSPTYYTWKGMVQRCVNPHHSAYSRYGGAGITICERWMVFESFLADMGIRPVNHTLDRIDNRSGYSPSNCRWATRSQQANNRNKNTRLEMHGESKTVAEWAEQYGLPYSLLYKRLNDGGWSLEKALTEPLRITSLTQSTRPAR